jgi:hypothetical protein
MIKEKGISPRKETGFQARSRGKQRLTLLTPISCAILLENVFVKLYAEACEDRKSGGGIALWI